MNRPTPLTRPRRGLINWWGLWNLYAREVLRFVKVYGQTLFAPVVMALLLLIVFTLVFDRGGRSIAGVPYEEFLVPGLVMMSIFTSAFANSSTSMGIAKFMGSHVDTLMSPLNSHELTAGYVLASVTRSILVAIVVILILAVFVPVHLHNVGFILFHAIGAASIMGLLGLMGAIWAQKIDHLASVTNFVITPLSFLSGTFYSIEFLPGIAQQLAVLNPLFYLIDGFRFGFIGISDGSLWIGIFIVIAVNAGLWLLCSWMFATGYKLKP